MLPTKPAVALAVNGVSTRTFYNRIFGRNVSFLKRITNL